MTKRIQQLFVTLAALAALALGGAVFAHAQASPSTSPEPTAAVDKDNVQAGDQTTPDSGKAAGATGQSGNQSTPDTGAVSETPGAESPASESAPGNDGPGGHADEPGNPTADHQFQGNE